MLNYHDNSPIIRHSILKKLGTEPGVKLVEINITPLAKRRFVYRWLLEHLPEPRAYELAAQVLGERESERSSGIFVGVYALIDDLFGSADILDGRLPEVVSCFVLPDEFELIQVHNEIDDMAESCKRARVRVFGFGMASGLIDDPNKPLSGRGLRYGWR